MTTDRSPRDGGGRSVPKTGGCGLSDKRAEPTSLSLAPHPTGRPLPPRSESGVVGGQDVRFARQHRCRALARRPGPGIPIPETLWRPDVSAQGTDSRHPAFASDSYDEMAYNRVWFNLLRIQRCLGPEIARALKGEGASIGP